MINEGQLLTNTAKGTEGDFKKILLESFINGIDLHTDLEGSYNLIFFDKKNCAFKLIRDYWGLKTNLLPKEQ